MVDRPEGRPDNVARRARTLVVRFGAALWHAGESFYTRDHLTYAASIAYYALLSLFPFFLLALTLLRRATANVDDRNEVLFFVLRYFPTQFDFITRQLDAFRESGPTLGVAGTLALVWGSLGVFSAVSSSVDRVWGVEGRRSFWTHKLLSFVMLLVAGLILLLALLLVSASQVVAASWFTEILDRFPGLNFLRGITVRHATTLLFMLVVGLVFYVVPNTRVRIRDVLVGALLTGLLWKGAIEAFSWYVRDMSRFTRVNGSIGAVVVFLLWVYLQAVMLLYGAEFTAAWGRERRHEQITQSRPPAP